MKKVSLLYLVNRIKYLSYQSIYDLKCKLCNQILTSENERIICSKCYLNVKLKAISTACKKCGRLVPENHIICGDCINNPPGFDKLCSYGVYTDEFRDLIKLYKYAEVTVLNQQWPNWSSK